MTVKEIAKEMGVSAGTVYKYIVKSGIKPCGSRIVNSPKGGCLGLKAATFLREDVENADLFQYAKQKSIRMKSRKYKEEEVKNTSDTLISLRFQNRKTVLENQEILKSIDNSLKKLLEVWSK